MVLKMPPTKIGRQVISAPNSLASGWMLWKARYVQGLEQSKKNSIMVAFSLVVFVPVCVRQILLVIPGRALARARNPYSLIVVMDSGLALRAPRTDESLFLFRHLLCFLPEHVLARLLVERLLNEFADRQPRLHLRPRPHQRVPAFHVRIIVEREALRLVGHGPGEAGDVGNRIVAGDVGPGLAQLGVEHAIEPCCLVAVALDG